MTPSSRVITSRNEISGINSAVGSVSGSAECTPSTFVALMISSASISMARRTAAVSVEKYGLPVPPAKSTTRPFSRWRSARLRMYGSASSSIRIALRTRVSTSFFSSMSWIASALITVASMPM